MSNLSDEIASSITGQTVNIIRAAAGLTRPVLAAIEDLEKELLRDLQDVVGKTDFTIARMKKLLAQAQATIAAAYGGIAVANQQGMVKLAEIAARQSLGAVNDAIGVKLTSVDWTKEQLEAIAKNTVVRGNFYEDWWKKQGQDTRARFEREMRIGQLRGETVDQLATRVRGRREMDYKDGIMATSRAQAQALVRTSALGVSNAARMAAYAKNDDVIKGVQWVSTLDNRTTPQCMALDGKRWNFPGGDGNADYADYKPIGHDKKFEVPPIHWNCRSTIIPLTYSWKELASEHGNSKAAAIADRVPRETRASMDGQVARTKTFGDWLAGKDKDFQDEVLGPARAEAWRQGKITITQLTDQNNNPLTLAQLGVALAPRLAPAVPEVAAPAAIIPETVDRIPAPRSTVSDLFTFTNANVPAQPTDVMRKLQAAVDDAQRKLDAAKAAVPLKVPVSAPTAEFEAITDKIALRAEANRFIALARNEEERQAIREAWANRAKEIDKIQRLAAAPPPPVPPPAAPPGAKLPATKAALSSNPIESSKRNYSNGIEESWIVKFKDGSRAIFKPQTFSSPIGYLNEVAASDIADMIGLNDLVPATIRKELSVGKVEGVAREARQGSLQAFVERSLPAGEVQKYTAFDGPKDAARAAAWDYFIGNQDRHHFNWMIQDGKKIALIDHGRAINFSKYGFRSNLVRWAQGKSTIIGVTGKPLPIPKEVANWSDKWPDIEAYLRKTFGTNIPDGLLRDMKARLDEMVRIAKDDGTFAELTQRFRE